MSIDYNGYRIRVWEDDDTNHAQMLKGRRGPVRLYVDIDAVDGGDGRQPSSKRLSGDIVRKHKFSGTATEQLVEVAKLWVDDPTQFTPSTPAIGASKQGI